MIEFQWGKLPDVVGEWLAAPAYLHVNQMLSSIAESPPLSFSSVAKNLGGDFAKDL